MPAFQETTMLLSDALESHCPKCYEPVTIYNPTPGATGYCKECLSCDWLVVSRPVIQDGVIIGGILLHEVKWCRSSKAAVDARKNSAEPFPTATAAPTVTTPVSDTAPVNPDQAAVLKTLLRAGGVTMTVTMIVGKVSLSEKTLRKVLRSLRGLGLVKAPAAKKGHCLTAAGQKRAGELSAEAGARLLKPESNAPSPAR
jgi:hypothetical protein